MSPLAEAGPLPILARLEKRLNYTLFIEPNIGPKPESGILAKPAHAGSIIGFSFPIECLYQSPGWRNW